MIEVLAEEKNDEPRQVPLGQAVVDLLPLLQGTAIAIRSFHTRSVRSGMEESFHTRSATWLLHNQMTYLLLMKKCKFIL